MVDSFKKENTEFEVPTGTKIQSINSDSGQGLSTGTAQIKINRPQLTLEEIKEDIDNLNKDLKKSRTEYIQIFGVFAAIITLVGFNASAAQKGIFQIIIGNIMLGFVFIGFIYLLYVVPKKIEAGEPVINLKVSKTTLITLLIFIIAIIYILFDKTTNIGLCSWYPLPHLELGSKIYCVK